MGKSLLIMGLAWAAVLALSFTQYQVQVIAEWLALAILAAIMVSIGQVVTWAERWQNRRRNRGGKKGGNDPE